MRPRLRTGDKDITQAARVIYRAAFNGEALPKRWRVWMVFDRLKVEQTPYSHGFTIGAGRYALGLCSYRLQTIFLCGRRWHESGAGCRGWLGKLIHEFVHVRNRGLRHGADFNHLVAAAYARVLEDR